MFNEDWMKPSVAPPVQTHFQANPAAIPVQTVVPTQAQAMAPVPVQTVVQQHAAAGVPVQTALLTNSVAPHPALQLGQAHGFQAASSPASWEEKMIIAVSFGFWALILFMSVYTFSFITGSFFEILHGFATGFMLVAAGLVGLYLDMGEVWENSGMGGQRTINAPDQEAGILKRILFFGLHLLLYLCTGSFLGGGPWVPDGLNHNGFATFCGHMLCIASFVVGPARIFLSNFKSHLREREQINQQKKVLIARQQAVAQMPGHPALQLNQRLLG